MNGERSNLFALTHLGLVFFFIFSAFMALQSIENSLNFENGLGTLSLSLVYGTNFISALFIGPPLIHILTPKWTMFVCFIAHSLFIIAHFWNSWQVLFAASCLLGIAFSPAWVANGTYLTVLATAHAQRTGKNPDQVLQLFNSLFYMMFSLHAVPGNMASSLILSTSREDGKSKSYKPTSDELESDQFEATNSSTRDSLISESRTSLWSTDSSLDSNSSLVSTLDSHSSSSPLDLSSEKRDIRVCGANHCPYIQSHTDTFEVPSTRVLYTLLGCFLSLNAIGLLLCSCLPSGVKTEKKFTAHTLLSTLKILRRRRMQLFLIPLCVTFVNDSLFYGSFTQSFVGCAYGIDHIGYATLAQAAGFFLVTVTCTSFADVVSQAREQVIYTNMVANVALMLAWLLWQPEEGEFWVILLLSAAHGVVHGVYKIQIGAMTSSLFPEDPEAAFSIYNLAFTAASCFTFTISFFLCFHLRVYIYLASLAAMFASFFTLERTMHTKTLTITDK